jgi:hypothetical protein
MEDYITVEEYLKLKDIQYDKSLIKRIERFLDRKIYRWKLSDTGLKINDKYLSRLLNEDKTAKRINKIISNHESINF